MKSGKKLNINSLYNIMRPNKAAYFEAEKASFRIMMKESLTVAHNLTVADSLTIKVSTRTLCTNLSTI